MTDMFGNVLSVGDRVVYAVNGSTEIHTAVVAHVYSDYVDVRSVRAIHSSSSTDSLDMVRLRSSDTLVKVGTAPWPGC